MSRKKELCADNEKAFFERLLLRFLLLNVSFAEDRDVLAYSQVKAFLKLINVT